MQENYQTREGEPTEGEIQPGTLDDHGNEYDPEAHEPRLKKDGTWCLRRGGARRRPGPRSKAEQIIEEERLANAELKPIVGTTIQCSSCGHRWPIRVDRRNSDGTMRVDCPSCGLRFRLTEESFRMLLAKRRAIRSMPR